ncbi:YoaK family protein [Streptomyces sp. NPDC090445]|uniref:YoaK family protein n=1 Tax=Streptomyces sp. NPDC090445 TaxID=3365963 RepID=UPI00381D1AA2
MQAKAAVALAPYMVVLTVTTGLVEAASLLTLGPVFTAMQTGNVLFLGFGLVGEGGLSVAAPAVSLGAFVAGAVIGARLETRLEADRHRWFVIALLVEALLVAVAAGTAWGLHPVHRAPTARHLATIAVLSTAMGIRNVTSLRVRVPDLPTTLVTRAMTALMAGSALGHDALLARGRAATARRAASVGAMFAGGLAGAAWVHAGWPVAGLLLVASAAVLLVAVAYVPRPRLYTD